MLHYCRGQFARWTEHVARSHEMLGYDMITQEAEVMRTGNDLEIEIET